MKYCGYNTPWKAVNNNIDDRDNWSVMTPIGETVIKSVSKVLAYHIAAIPDMVDFFCVLNKSMADVYDTIEFIGTEAESIVKQVKS